MSPINSRNGTAESTENRSINSHPKTVLVVGGAGYIGSHVSSGLLKRGNEVLVLDDLSTGHMGALHGLAKIAAHEGAHFESYVGSCRDEALLTRIFKTHDVSAVMHFGARAQVGESVQDPLLYFDANVSSTTTLLRQCVKHRVPSFVFSSTCATFGLPERLPMDETLSQRPINPYGLSKLMVEQILREASRAHGLRVSVLRYFNAAGCSPEELLGEDHRPETHLIPNIFFANADNPLHIHGTDYPTADGTCIRDYVHVLDLMDAHILAMEYLQEHEGFHDFNLGSAEGYSVREVLAAVGRPVAFVEGPRRVGDPPKLVADSSKAQKILGWKPRRNLKEILGSVAQWQKQFPAGFTSNKVLFLDRDGTLNADLGGNDRYVSQTSDLLIIPGVAKVLKLAKKQGFLLSLITNQAGIGKGLMSIEDLNRVHEDLERKLGREMGADFKFDDIQYCAHRTEDDCYCRKPFPGMLIRSAVKLNADLKSCIFVGDHIRDMECAKFLGIRGERVDTVRKEDLQSGTNLTNFKTLTSIQI